MFLVEGNKTISELKDSGYRIREIFSVNDHLEGALDMPVTIITEGELRKISFLKTPKDSVAACELKEARLKHGSAFNLVLDGIQDPGNLGTIIRLADWFGVTQIVCSEDTVDLYNPKVIQATMGSFTRVSVVYTDLVAFLRQSDNLAVGTAMEGESIYDFEFSRPLNLVFGNEGNGMRAETAALVKSNITVPRFGAHQSTESLNVSMAAAVILGQAFHKKSR